MKPTYKSYNQQTYLYTKGLEFMLGLEPYVGEYHIRQGRPWTEPVDSPTSKPLNEYYAETNILVYESFSNIDIRSKNYIEPYDSFDTPTINQYKNGYMTRHFVKRKNDNSGVIMEISNDLAKLYGKPNGIDDVLYDMVKVRWRLTNKVEEINQVIHDNFDEIMKAKLKMPGIEKYFTSAFEYSYEII